MVFSNNDRAGISANGGSRKVHFLRGGSQKRGSGQGGNPAHPKSKKGQNVSEVKFHLRFANRWTEECMSLGQGPRGFFCQKRGAGTRDNNIHLSKAHQKGD